MTSWTLAIALGFALSPQWAELYAHLAEHPWSRYTLVFPVLFGWSLWSEEPQERSLLAGWLLVATALALELVAVGGGVTRFGRPALALAAVGLCRALGLTRWRTALLAAWAIPVPNFLLAGVGVPLAILFGHTVAALLGIEAVSDRHVEGVQLVASSGSILLGKVESGLALVALLSGIGWFVAVRAGRSPARCLLRAVLFGCAALGIQLACVVVAAVTLVVGSGSIAQPLIAVGPWLAGGCVGLAAVVRERHTERSG